VRVVFVSHTYLDASLRGKLRALAALGCTISVAVPERWSAVGPGQNFTASWGNDGGIRIVPIKVSGSDRGVRSSWSGSGLRRLFTDFRPNLVQVEEEPWTPAGATATRQATSLKLPTVVFGWESVARPYSMVETYRRRKTVQRALALIGGNKLAAGLLAKLKPGAPVAVIPQLGLTPPIEPPRGEHQGLALGFVGRLVPEKGLDTLFRACVKLHGRWSLTVVGSGPAQEELEALAERLGIAARVTWTGPLPAAELPRLWPQLDCLVVPSRTTPRWVETFHPALVEAMGHAVTVVGTDSGAIPELIDTAGLVVPEDDVVALTGALQHLSDSPRERARLGREARLRVMSEYVDDAVARRTLEFWESVLRRA
jgi:glycosyltransferase involved in cell wall biosynthesis